MKYQKHKLFGINITQSAMNDANSQFLISHSSGLSDMTSSPAGECN